MRVRSLAQEDALEEGMAVHSSILAWRIPWTEEPGGLQLQRVCRWLPLPHPHHFSLSSLHSILIVERRRIQKLSTHPRSQSCQAH